MKKTQLKLDTITQQLSEAATKVGRYKVILFFVFVALLYGFVMVRINSLARAEPTQDQISAQSNIISTGHIDSTVEQLKKLQDNSVSVQTLFQQARSNPFQDASGSN